MRRRTYLGLAGASLIAGCTGGSDEAVPTDTPAGQTETRTEQEDTQPTDTETITQASTPDPEPPEVLFVNLISSFDQFGDVRSNSIESAPRGSDILIGWREETWVHDGTYATTTQVEILDGQNNRVAVNQDADDQVVNSDGAQEWEGAMSFRADWEPGEYTAEVIVRDDETDMVSEPESGTFEITEPEPKLEIIREERYVGEYDSGVRGTAENVSEDTLAYAEVTAVFLDDQGRQIGDGLDNTNNLSPGREWQFDVGYYGEKDFAEYELSLDWRVD